MASPLKKDPRVKTSDMFRMSPYDLLVDPDFNPRSLDKESTQTKIMQMAEAYRDGRTLPPLMCRREDDGYVLVIDGHCRLEAAKIAIRNDWVPADFRLKFDVFQGSKADALAFALSSGDVTDPLTAMEKALGYARLRGQGYEVAEIAKMVSRPAPVISRHLLLADADKDLQDMVRDGTVAASTMIELLGEGGNEKARQALAKATDAAKSEGREKVKPADVRKATGGAFKRYVPKEMRPHLEAIKARVSSEFAALGIADENDDDADEDQTITVPVSLLRPLLAMLDSKKEGA